MGRGISGETQIELLRLLRERYKGSSKSDKTKILVFKVRQDEDS